MATIQGIYIALFGRPADPVGYRYFSAVTKNGADLSGIGNLAGQAEYLTRFAGQTNDQIVNSIYQSLFGRIGEAEGVSFWVKQLETGRFTINNIAIAILDGARNDDKTVIAAKLAAAELFTAHLDLPVEEAAYVGTFAAQVGREYITSITPANIGTGANADAAIARLFTAAGQAPAGDIGGGASTDGDSSAPNRAPTVSVTAVSGNSNSLTIIKPTGDAASPVKLADFTATDPDGTNTQPSVRVAVVAGGNGLTVEARDGAIFATGISTATPGTYSINVTATDGGNLSDTKPLTVKVVDINQLFPDKELSFNEGQGTSASITVSDASAFKSLTASGGYSIEKTEDGKYVLKHAGSFDYENPQEDRPVLKVTATDDIGRLVEKPFKVEVKDVNEAPVVSVKATDGGNSVTFAKPAGDLAISTPTTIGQASATDPEGNPFTFAGGRDDVGIKIDPKSGAISFFGTVKTGTYKLAVTASDGEKTSDPQEFTVKIEDAVGGEKLQGTDSADKIVLLGSEKTQYKISAGGGDDVIDLSANSGSAIINGGAGKDTIILGKGQDKIVLPTTAGSQDTIRNFDGKTDKFALPPGIASKIYKLSPSETSPFGDSEKINPLVNGSTSIIFLEDDATKTRKLDADFNSGTAQNLVNSFAKTAAEDINSIYFASGAWKGYIAANDKGSTYIYYIESLDGTTKNGKIFPVTKIDGGVSNSDSEIFEKSPFVKNVDPTKYSYTSSTGQHVENLIELLGKKTITLLSGPAKPAEFDKDFTSNGRISIVESFVKNVSPTLELLTPWKGIVAANGAEGTYVYLVDSNDGKVLQSNDVFPIAKIIGGSDTPTPASIADALIPA